MKKILRYGFLLVLICMVAAGFSARVNSQTRVKVISQAQAEDQGSLGEVMPQAAAFKAVRSGNDIIYYQALDKDGRLIGAAFRVSAKGYSSAIESISGMLKDGTITAIKIVSQNETPGLGARVAEKQFTEQFTHKHIPDLSGVQAITGATISSQAVIDAVKAKAEEVQGLLKDAQ